MKNKLSAMMMALSFIIGMSTGAIAGSDDIIVEAPWSRASIGTSRPSVAYMTIRNRGTEAVTLTGLQTEAAMRAEVHRTSTDEQGLSRMEPAGDIVIAPGETVSLEPGGLHAMLMMLSRPLTEGETFPLLLKFDDGSELTVDVPILSIATRGPEG